jgi:hypothetical protein
MDDLYKHRTYFEPYKPNIEYDFVYADDDKPFFKLIKNHPDNKSLKYYIENPIKYKFNNYGFRTPDDFNSTDEGNIFLGDSHTFGIGHHLENVWSYKLNNLIGGKFWNISVPGTGIMTSYRLLKGFIKEMNVKNIFHYAPKYGRYEFFIDGIPTNIIINTYNHSWDKLFGEFIEKSLIDDVQIDFTYDSYCDAIRGVAAEMGVNYYYLDWKPTVDEYTTCDGSLQARDIFHFSTKLQHKIFLKFLENYNYELFEKNNSYDGLIYFEDDYKIQNIDDAGNTKTKKTIL